MIFLMTYTLLYHGTFLMVRSYATLEHDFYKLTAILFVV